LIRFEGGSLVVKDEFLGTEALYPSDLVVLNVGMSLLSDEEGVMH